jgi:hypothetical protein
MRRGRHLSFAPLIAVLLSGCSGASPTQPSGGAVATIRVVDETFRVKLVTQDQVDAARRASAGALARIPTGRIVTGTEVNTGWRWHLEDVAFVEAAIEACDGRPSQVEQLGPAFGGGRFCPWAASVIRVDP